MRWLIAVAIPAAFSSCAPDAPRAPSELIQQALAASRPFLPRLAGQKTHHPCQLPPLRPASTSCTVEGLSTVDVPAARCEGFPWSRELALALEGSRTHEARVLELAHPKPNPRATLEALERNASAHPADANHLINLGAAYLVAAGESDRPEWLIQAIEVTARAVELAPTHPEALFNHALAVSAFHLETPAKAAWEAYLALEPEGPWADEAHRHLAALGEEVPLAWGQSVQDALRAAVRAGAAQQLRKLISPLHQQVREWVQHDLLAEWAKAVEAGQASQAQEVLTLAKRLADELTALTGDVLLRDGVAALVAAKSAPERRAELARGHRLLFEGYGKIYGWMPEQALPPLEEAAQLLTRASSPFAAWTRFYHALATYYTNQSRNAERELAALASDVEGKSYTALQGRIAWVRGLAVSSLQELQPAADHYQHAAGIFCGIGEVENRAAAQSLFASALSRLGKEDLSWGHVYAAFSQRHAIINPVRGHALLEDAVFGALRGSLNRTARAFSDEHVQLAASAGNPQLVHLARVRSSAVFVALGETPSAARELQFAVRAHESLQSPALRQRGDADSALARGKALLESDPRLARDFISVAIRGFAEQDFLQRLPEAYLARAQASLALSEPAKAEWDLESAIRLLELGRQEVVAFSDRVALAQLTRSTYDAMMDLQVHEHRGLAKAFATSEALRAALGPSGEIRPGDESAGDPTSLEVIQERLPDGTALLVTTVLPRATLLWLIERDSVQAAEAGIDLNQLAADVHDLRRALVAGSCESWREASMELSRQLIAPVGKRLPGLRQLVVVGDRFLHDLPFEVLVNPRSGRLLVEELAVVYAPSAAVHARLSASAHVRTAGTSPAMLAVAGRSDGQGELPALPAASREATAAARLYPGSKVLAGATISRSAVLAALRDVEIFHFAGHSRRKSPPAPGATLVLSDTEQGQELITAAQLGTAATGLRVAVLSACSTAKAGGNLEAPLSELVEPLLSAGVPAVVGSLWDVEDSEAEALILAFHRNIATGQSASTALQRAKLETLHSSRPRAWAGWVLVGASPEAGQQEK